MRSTGAGSFLEMMRRLRRKSLRDISDRMGRKGISKQALSLIENGHMRIPAARLDDLKHAYGLSISEGGELDKLYAFERLVKDTGEDREFGEAILSVVEVENATSIYVIGGRSLSLTSPILQAKAAEFLGRPDNRLVFIYPKSNGFIPPNGSLFFPNTVRDMALLEQSVQAFSKLSVKNRIQFYGLDVRSAGSDPLLLEALSLCGPFSAMTLTSPRHPEHVVGYVYVDGPRDRWVLLRAEHAKRALDAIQLLLEKAVDNRGIVRESLS